MNRILALVVAIVISIVPQSLAFANEDMSVNFRNVRWGMSREEVTESESETELFLMTDGVLCGRVKILDMDALVVFQFDSDRLYHAGYIISDIHTNDNLYFTDYKRVVEKYTTKYGAPVSSVEDWSRDFYKDKPSYIGTAIGRGDVSFHTQWRMESTDITILLKGNNYTCVLAMFYYDNTYERVEDLSGI